jgi:biotin-[acetyl-CoA-carboxylase] ligase BirA-like protein
VENQRAENSLEKAATVLAAQHAVRADVHYLPAVDSTNSWLKSRFEAGAVSRSALVLTDSQTAGRGTRGREWLQGGRDIALSCGVLIPLDQELDPRLSLAVGATVADTIEATCGLPSRVKWPNDVLTSRLDDQESDRWYKVSGTLIETLLSTGGRLVVIGVGVNVNSTVADYPQPLAERVTTLRDALGEAVDRGAVAVHLGLNLLGLADLLSASLAESTSVPTELRHLVDEWFARDITAGTKYLLRRDGNEIPVTAERVDRLSGGLICRDEQQREHLVTAYTDLSPADNE